MGSQGEHVERTYVVTGAGGGIGGATTRLLLAEGATVVGVDFSGSRLSALTATCEQFQDRLRTVKSNVTNEEDVGRVVATAVDEFPVVHGVANIAGGMVDIDEHMFDVPLERMALSTFMKTYELNTVSAFLYAKALTPHFTARGYGKVVNTASLAAFANRPELGNVAYNAAKAAVVALTQSVSLLQGSSGIRANAVAPGLILSDRVRQWMHEGYLSRHVDQTALGRLATVEEAAEVFSFLLSSRSDGISGEVVRVAAGVR